MLDLENALHLAKMSKFKQTQSVNGVAEDDEEKKRMCHRLHSLMNKYEEIARKKGVSSSINQLLNSSDLPYSLKVIAMLLPPKFKVPQMKMYNGSKDSVYHLEKFKAHMTLHNFLREVVCRAFPLTLKGLARGCGLEPWSSVASTTSKN